MTIEAFIFDLDGVITNTAKFHYEAWYSLAQSIGITINTAFNETLKGISRSESLNRILEYGNRQDDFNQDEKRVLMDKKNTIYQEMILKIDENAILKGVTELLMEIRKNKIKIGLASASQNGTTVIKRLGLFSYFDGIVLPSELKEGKPSPEIFIKAAEMLKVSPTNCVGLEDAQAGIDSINRAQMFSVGIGNKKDLKNADLLVADTSSLSFKKIQQQFVNYHSFS